MEDKSSFGQPDNNLPQTTADTQNLNEERASQAALTADPEQTLPLLDQTAVNTGSKLLLRLVADMFRQQADLYSQQAVILERVATAPHLASSWKIGDETPEMLQKRLLQGRTSAVAMKSYEGMLQVQKRVDYMASLIKQNGIKEVFREVAVSNAKGKNYSRRPAWQRCYKKEQPIYWFRREHFDHILEEVKVENPSDSEGKLLGQVRKKIETIWSSMNPAQRLPYIQKAQAAVTITVSAKEKAPARSRKRREKTTAQESISGSSEEDEIFEEDHEEQDHSDTFSEPLLGQKSEEDDNSDSSSQS